MPHARNHAQYSGTDTNVRTTMRLYSKLELARAKSVTTRCIDMWVQRELLPKPLKLGTTRQARVRWTQEAVEVLDRNLMARFAPSPATSSSGVDTTVRLRRRRRPEHL